MQGQSTTGCLWGRSSRYIPQSSLPRFSQGSGMSRVKDSLLCGLSHEKQSRVPPSWVPTAPHIISETLRHVSQGEYPNKCWVLMAKGLSCSWDLKQDQPSGCSCQLPVLTHQLEHAKTCLEWRRKGHHGWSHTPPDCYKITSQCWDKLILGNLPTLFCRNQNSTPCIHQPQRQAQEAQREAEGLKVKRLGIHGPNLSWRPL